MRGEKVIQQLRQMRGWGSPPHARGKVRIIPYSCGREGITPACAGKSGCWNTGCCWNWDHPRMRGEKSKNLFFSQCRMGSPPHARGKESTTACSVAPTRITPACAGKRCLNSKARMDGWDHPRMRGEKDKDDMQLYAAKGSPPHARGKVPQTDLEVKCIGITPACAGKSPHRFRRRRSDRDHPRMRGEKSKEYFLLMDSKGSPPHARGKE